MTLTSLKSLSVVIKCLYSRFLGFFPFDEILVKDFWQEFYTGPRNSVLCYMRKHLMLGGLAIGRSLIT